MALDLSSIPINFDNIERDAEKLSPSKPTNPIHLTVEELSAYSGTVQGRPIYIALLGNIYDVSTGKTFYAPGGAYEIFAGKDATRGLASFNMSSKRRKADNEENQKDDYSDMSEKHMESAKRWQKLFESEFSTHRAICAGVREWMDPRNPLNKNRSCHHPGKYPLVGHLKRAPRAVMHSPQGASKPGGSETQSEASPKVDPKPSTSRDVATDGRSQSRDETSRKPPKSALCIVI